jgi:hypothetical protein
MSRVADDMPVRTEPRPDETYEINLASGRQVRLVIAGARVGPYGAIERDLPLKGRIPFPSEIGDAEGEEIFINPRHIESFRRVS